MPSYALLSVYIAFSYFLSTTLHHKLRPKTHTHTHFSQFSPIPLSFCAFLLSQNMLSCQAWPEPVVRVQALAESGLSSIPSRYIKPLSQRPSTNTLPSAQTHHQHDHDHANIPVIDMEQLFSKNESVRKEGLKKMAEACSEWGFFQVVNHGVSHDLMKSTRELWRDFFNQPLEVKEEYANSPSTYEGYGSRLGVQKGATLDWSDYFFLHYMPLSVRNQAKWPAFPSSLRYISTVTSPTSVKNEIITDTIIYK